MPCASRKWFSRVFSGLSFGIRIQLRPSSLGRDKLGIRATSYPRVSTSHVMRCIVLLLVLGWDVLNATWVDSGLSFGITIQLRPSSFGRDKLVPVEDAQIKEELSYEETPIAILDWHDRKLRTKAVNSVKVLWRNKNREEVTWEGEDGMRVDSGLSFGIRIQLRYSILGRDKLGIRATSKGECGSSCLQSKESEDSGVTIQDTAVSSLVVEVKSRQQEDLSLEQLRAKAQNQQTLAFDIAGDGVLRYSGRLYVPNVAGLPHQIMEEAHHSCYSIHPGSTKMYHDIKEIY
ncbi:hypothetical protein MTR67_030942 [Solanum verrucosum]|uniref:Uncharacterized protein n=1 Tax=Solanum verrucosum TaxID=315347 RepID=A0AAF0U1J6_SOLVR|nr:hypothetical protein MTR67_030942 [Solanum verrucosum]